MSQKNIFTVIAAILVLQSIAAYFMGSQIAADVWQDLGERGNFALKINLQLVAVITAALSLITYASRSNPQVLWAYTAGFGLVGLNSLKHMFVDQVNVPIWALVIQLGIALVCGYLWTQNRKTETT